MSAASSLRFAPVSRCALVIEPDVQSRRLIAAALEMTCAVRWFSDAPSLLGAVGRIPQANLILMSWLSMDLSLAGLKEILAAKTGAPVLLLCSPNHVDDMKHAMELGATGFLQMPASGDALKRMVTERLALLPAPIRLDEGNLEETPLGDGLAFVRSSRRMRKIESEASLIARSDIAVLILGESGAGKEVLAKYIHAMSDRGDKIFMKVNCAAMPAELLESELYGHEKGAFTGAVKSVPGKFEVCDGGTIFLDEIGEMSAALQAKLLHVLQDGVYMRVGGRVPIRCNVRIIAATNIDVKSAMAQEAFRKDLYYRLSGFSITLPPLRERKEEIASFARHFMKKAALKHGRRPLPISEAMLEALKSYDWPGNLRELENVINRYLVMGDAQSIVAELGHVAQPYSVAAFAGLAGGVGLKRHLDLLNQKAESATIAKVLEEVKWNRRAAAKRMQISYTSLLQKIKRYDLSPHERVDSNSNRTPVARAENQGIISLSLACG